MCLSRNLFSLPMPQHNPADSRPRGLGIGTTPAALVAHGIDTTIVEIDPVVHEFASKYFRLPSNHTAVIEDAVAYAARLAAMDERDGGERFDYIVHDVFTGGAVPIALFTLEFLQDLAAILRPNGVIAIVRGGPLPHIPLRCVWSLKGALRVLTVHGDRITLATSRCPRPP